MLAVNANRETVAEAIAGIDETCIANLNAPQQTVVSGTEAGLEQAAAEFAARGIRTHRLDVACAFHSPWMADAREPLAAALAECGLQAPAKPVYSNVTAAPLPDDPAGIAALLVEHLTSPVRFQEEVEAMYAAGARIFVEVGPQGVVTGLVSRILGNRPHVAVATNAGIREDLVQLQHALAHLLTCGVDLRLDRLFAGREVQRFPWAQLAQQSAAPQYGPTTWLVNNTRVRPINGPEPATLGQPNPSGSISSCATSRVPRPSRPCRYLRTTDQPTPPWHTSAISPSHCHAYRICHTETKCAGLRPPGATGVSPVPSGVPMRRPASCSASRT